MAPAWCSLPRRRERQRRYGVDSESMRRRRCPRYRLAANRSGICARSPSPNSEYPMRLPLLLAVLTLVATTTAESQRLGPEVKRPKLAASADTNDALAYLEHGMALVQEKSAEAADAFYWSARLDPSAPGALYGRRIALLLRRPNDLRSYMSGNRRARENKNFLAIDSLQFRALRLDPMMFRSLDRTLLYSLYFVNYRASGGDLTRKEFEREISFILKDEPPATRAWVMYGDGEYEQAIAEYEVAIKQSRNPVNLRIERARVLALRARFREAITEFTLALEELRKRDDKRDEFVVFYDSKALLEHSIGVMHLGNNNADSARAAFGRAMTEDLSYFPPHVALGKLALAQNDSVTAVAELGLAAELATDEPYIHFLYGQVLSATGQHADAIAPLRRAIEMEPYYAAPHQVLGESLERTGDTAGARLAYTKFLSLAPKRDVQNRDAVTRRLQALAP